MAQGTSAFTQDWKMLQPLDSLVNEGQYWQAYEPALAAVKKNNRRKGSPHAKALLLHARVAHELNRLTEALASADEALQYATAPDSLYFDALQWKARILHTQGQYATAESLLRQCLAEQEAQPLRHPANLLESYQSLAQMLGHAARYDEALPVLEKALVQCRSPHDSLAVATQRALLLVDMHHLYDARTLLETQLARYPVSRNTAFPRALDALATIRTNSGDQPGALALLEQAEAWYHNTSNTHRPEYGTTLDRLGGTLFWTRTNAPAADSIFRLASEAYAHNFGPGSIREDWLTLARVSLWPHLAPQPGFLQEVRQATQNIARTFGEGHFAHANALFWLGSHYANLGLHLEELAVKQQMANIYRDALGEDHPNYANALNTLGAQYQSAGFPLKAIPCHATAVSIYTRLFGEGHFSLRHPLEQLAQAKIQQGLLDEAKVLNDQAQHLQDTLAREGEDDLSTLYQAFAWSQGGNAERADSLVQATLLQLERQHTRHSSRYAKFVNLLALLRNAELRYSEADSLQLVYLSILSSFADTSSLYYLKARCDMSHRQATVAGQDGQQWYKNLSQRIALHHGEQSTLYANYAKAYADFCRDNDQFDRAIPLYQLALAHYAQSHGPASIVYLGALNNLALVLDVAGQYHEAETLLDSIVQTHRHTGTATDPSIWNNLGFLRDAFGKYAEAENCYHQVLRHYQRDSTYTKSPDMVYGLVNLAHNKLNQSQFDSTAMYLAQAETINAYYPEDLENHIQIIAAYESLHSRLGHFHTSDSLAKVSLRMALDHYGENHSGLISRYNNQATAAFKLGRFHEADSLTLRAAEVQCQVLGTENAPYATLMNNLANMAVTQGRFGLAEAYIDSSMHIRQRIFPNPHPTWADSYHAYCELYFRQGRYAESIENAKQAADLYDQFYGPDNVNSTYPLSFIAEAWIKMGQYAAADSLFSLIARVDSSAYGSHSINTVYDRISSANLERILGQYKKAEQSYLDIYAAYENIFKTPNHYHATVLSHLAEVFSDQQAYEQADTLRLISHALYTQYYGDNHYRSAKALIKLAATRRDLGHYREADSLFSVGITTLKAAYAAPHPDIAEALAEQAALLRISGRLSEAQVQIDQARTLYVNAGCGQAVENILLDLEMAKLHGDQGGYLQAEASLKSGLDKLAQLNPTHPRMADFFLEQAILYGKLSLWAKAEAALQSCQHLLEAHFPEGHPLLAKAVATLAELKLEQGQSEEVVGLLQTALQQYKRHLPAQHPDVLDVQLLLARHLESTDPEAAEKLYDSLGEQLTQSGKFSSLAKLYQRQTWHYFEQGKLAQAQTATEAYRTLLNKTYPAGHYRQAELDLLQAYLYALRADEVGHESFAIRLADSLLASGAAHYRTYMLAQFPLLSETEKMAFLAGKVPYFDLVNTLCAYLNTPAARQAAFDLALFRKGAVLASVQDLRRTVRAQGNAEALVALETSIARRREIARLEESPAEHTTTIRQLEAEAAHLETHLQRTLPQYTEALNALATDWRQIQQHLSPEGLHLEYLQYKLPGTDSLWYGVLGLRNDWDAPRFIPLCAAATLERKLNEHLGERAEDYVNALYRYEGAVQYERSRPGSGPPSHTVSLYKVLWQPLEPWLDGVRNISYVPEGLLHRINPAAIGMENGEFLVQRYPFRRFSSARKLLEATPTKQWDSEDYLLLFGDVHFQALEPTSTNAEPFPYLPNTLNEANNIQGLFERQNRRVVRYRGSDAGEAQLKAHLDAPKKPRILHLPTHGAVVGTDGLVQQNFDANNLRSTIYAVPATEPLSAAALFAHRQALSRSFVALAFANDYWRSGNKFQYEDGLLTAYELAQANADGVELAVLSACQTALGELSGGEGMMGLARALKMAGAQNVLVSLWYVPDAKTEVLMSSFYDFWLKNPAMSVQEAFREAQLDMVKRRDTPFQWGSFILVE